MTVTTLFGCDLVSYVIISLFACITSFEFADGDVDSRTVAVTVGVGSAGVGDVVAAVGDVGSDDIFNFIKLFFKISSVALPPLE